MQNKELGGDNSSEVVVSLDQILTDIRLDFETFQRVKKKINDRISLCTVLTNEQMT